jgi:hypothetical protein
LTTSTFQQASCKTSPSFILGRTIKVFYEVVNGFKERSRESFNCWEEGGREEVTARQINKGTIREILEEKSNALDESLTLGWE